MKLLADLVAKIPLRTIDPQFAEKYVSGISIDSRTVQKGDLFIALKGRECDGLLFVKEAVHRGACAVISETGNQDSLKQSIPHLSVPNSRQAFSEIAQAFYNYPARKLTFSGVTGTNGKTTSTFLIHHLLSQQNPCGLVGSISYWDGKEETESHHTTPDALHLNQLFVRMIQNQVTHCVMEVSSHGLDQERVFGIQFSSAVFTNLTQDHLDYHHNMETYYAAKKKLFVQQPAPKHSIINLDDAFGRRLESELPKDGTVWTYGFGEDVDFRATNVEIGFKQVRFTLEFESRDYLVEANLGLGFNVYNILGSLAAVYSMGVPLEEALARLKSFQGVRGRLERVSEARGISVFVDYAHTPDAMERVLSSMRKLTNKRILSVFGCGGERDRDKRPKMAKIACQYSDIVLVTTDNPRRESQGQIFSDIFKGIDTNTTSAEVLRIEDRAEAIECALQIAQFGDIVLIFGKGHEAYQIIGNEKKDFSDQEVVRAFERKKCLVSGKLRSFATGRL